MRIYVLSLFVTILVFYAWKDWYKALCGLVVMMAFLERPDMPKSMLGIPGLNPWNILLASIIFAYLATRKRDGLVWDMPKNMDRFLKFYVFIILFATLRELFDFKEMVIYALGTGWDVPSFRSLFIDDIINTFKYMVPAFLMYVGCKDEDRLKFAYGAILLLNVLLALQIMRWMPLSEITDGDALKDRASRVLDREIGYYRSDLAILLAGASWAFYAFRELLVSKMLSLMALGGSAISALGMVLTGGRIGIVSWGVVAFALAVLKWRKFLILAPVAVLLIGLAIPSVMERMTQGFTQDTAEERSSELEADVMSSGGADLYTITAGRTAIWPYVFEKIGEKPFLGWGRKAMQRSGVSAFLGRNFGEIFPHPHNAYLQLVFDNGFIFALPIFLLYLTIISYSITLLRDKTNNLYVAIGGGTFAFVVAQLVGSTGSQSFYPEASSVSLWCMMALMLRVYVQRDQLMLAANKPDETKFEEPESEKTQKIELWSKIERKQVK